MRLLLFALLFLCACASAPRIPDNAIKNTEMWPSGSLKSRHYHTLDDTGAIIRNGPYEAWHESGAPHIRGHYQNDLKNGPWYYYLNSGQKEKTVYFDKGEPKRTILPSPYNDYPDHFPHHHLHHPHW